MAKHKSPRGSVGVYVDGGVQHNRPQQVKELARSIERILTAGFKAHADQETIRHALDTFKEGTRSAQHVTIANNSIEMREG